MSQPLDIAGITAENCDIKLLCNQCIKVIVQKHDGKKLEMLSFLEIITSIIRQT